MGYIASNTYTYVNQEEIFLLITSGEWISMNMFSKKMYIKEEKEDWNSIGYALSRRIKNKIMYYITLS